MATITPITGSNDKKTPYVYPTTNTNKSKVITPTAPQGSNNNKTSTTLQGSNQNKSPSNYKPSTLQGSNDNKTLMEYSKSYIENSKNKTNVITPTSGKTKTTNVTGNLDKVFNDSSNIKTNITESNVVMPNPNDFNKQAPKLVADYTDNTETIKSLYSEEKRQQLVNDYNNQKELIEQEANLQKQKNIDNTEQSIRQAYQNTNQMLRDLAQIKSNLGGASVNDPTFKQGMININTSLTNLISDKQAQLNEVNSMVEVEKQKAINQNNMTKYDKLQAFDTALVSAYIGEINRIDTIKNSINEKNADLQMAQQELNKSSYQFAATLAQQEKERQDALS